MIFGSFGVASWTWLFRSGSCPAGLAVFPLPLALCEIIAWELPALLPGAYKALSGWQS